jgi:hypothetical protein
VKIGACAANGPITEADLSLFQLGGFEAAKLMANDHTAKDLGRLWEAGVRSYTLRLRDSLWWRTRADSAPESFYPDWRDWVAKAVADTVPFYRELKVRDPKALLLLQYDCEPNCTWLRSDKGPGDYQWWVRQGVPRLRVDLAKAGVTDFRLVSPPLSFAPKMWSRGKSNPSVWILDEWFAGYMWKDGGKVQNLLELFDMVGVNAYWQHRAGERADKIDEMYDPSYGACFEQMHERAGGKPVVLLELNNSSNDRTVPPSPGELEKMRVRDLPEYLGWVDTFTWVEQSHIFSLGGSWSGFLVTEAEARAISRVRGPNEVRSQVAGPVRI